LASFDVITDYALGEQIDVPSTVAATTLTASSGNSTSLTAAAIQAVLTGETLRGNLKSTRSVLISEIIQN